MTALFRAQSLTGGYGHAKVLREVSFEVSENEVVAVFGANGAGKTSCLRAISGSLPNCTGHVQLDGVDLSGAKPWERVAAGLCHVPEGRHVFSAMTVKENLQAAALVGRPAVSMDDVYDLFPRLRERAAQSAGSMSGGEQQMLAIARGLMCGPRLLAIDEMSAGLAPATAQELVEALGALRDTGFGVLLVEQSPHLVADLVDTVYVLEAGCIIGIGSFADFGGPDGLADLYLGVA
jgi:branched-chain amino acid transport system ATP-binding protein